MIKNSSWHGNYLKLLRWLKILVDVEILTDFWLIINILKFDKFGLN